MLQGRRGPGLARTQRLTDHMEGGEGGVQEALGKHLHLWGALTHARHKVAGAEGAWRNASP